MRGKKSDPEFISNFITECITNKGLHNPVDIVEYAKSIIHGIDEEIKNIEQKKVMRSKLLDVIANFDSGIKNKTEEAKLLNFFKIENPLICKKICDIIKNKPKSIKDKKFDSDTKFAIKQLIEYKVICKLNNQLLRSDSFDDYMTFVLRETK